LPTKSSSKRFPKPAIGNSLSSANTSKSLENRPRESWRNGVLLPSLASGLLLWTAFAPLHWTYLAWLAPLGWLIVIDRKRPVSAGGYVALWLGGCLFWLLILQGIRLAFWALLFGWLALALYLALYTPLFVATARLLHHRWRLPLLVAAPIAWIGMELFRSYLFTGYAANSLAHSQFASPILIQSADQFGTAGIAWVMLSVSVAILRAMQVLRGGKLNSLVPTAITAGLLFAVMLGYGYWKLAEADQLYNSQQPALRALLVQENTPTIFEYNPERSEDAWNRYLELTRIGVRQSGPVDLIVWPESTFTANEPLFAARLSNGVPADLKARGYNEPYQVEFLVEELNKSFHLHVTQLLRAIHGTRLAEPPSSQETWPHLLVGCDHVVITSEEFERYNAALFIDNHGSVVDVYNKVHLVMFGEYVPLGSALKWLGDMFGLAGATPGREAKSMQLGRVRLAPNICFESVVPWLISGQLRKLAADGESPDIMVNLTNDSWFRGSSILDHHLASTVLVAVENRKPMLVAANTGLSAHIAGSGRVMQVSERLVPTTLLAEVKLDGRGGLVQSVGYPLGWICGAICLMGWMHGLIVKLRPSNVSRAVDAHAKAMP
jgi:apolipoprotein N-acyltransferase